MTHQGPEFSLLAALVVSHCEPFCFLKRLAPLVPLANGARCGNNPNSTILRVTIVCAKR
jgi:hypothetical protein